MRVHVLATHLALVLATSAALGQISDAALRDRVNQLVERLGAADSTRADEAEKALIDLGPRVLPLLPQASPDDQLSTVERLERVRTALEEAAQGANLGPSIVTIQGDGIRLSEALRMLQQQSGNRIGDLREQYGQDAANPAMDLEIDGKPFFEALDLVCKASGLTPNFYTGDGTIGLMALDDASSVAVPSDNTGDRSWIVYSGPFRIHFQQIAARRDFTTGNAEASARFEVAWEPRLRPMLLSLSAQDVAIVDDRGQEVAPSVMMESDSVVLRPENPVAELNLNMNAPERAAQSLATLTVKANVTLPGGVRTFRFDDLSKPARITNGEVSARIVSTQVDDFVWKVRLFLEYPGEGPAFESYQQGLFNNRLWLQKADGTRFEHNGGFSNLGSAQGRIGFEYLFVDAPGTPSDWGLIYETPSRVETIPLEFTFEDVPLP